MSAPDSVTLHRLTPLKLCAYSAPLPPAVRLPGSAIPERSGAYQITGTVDELGVPGAYRVLLLDRASGRPVAETTSGADGAYQFEHLEYRAAGYVAIAFDSGSEPRNAAIADLITPEPMP